VLFQLRHPHIVQVTDIIETNGLLGMVMEWVEGEDLEQWLKRQTGSLDWEYFYAICVPFLEAMQYIHDQGLVHRDLKPANILLHREHGRSILKVADFGLVKVLDDLDNQLTQTHTQMGTAAYMSPEQIREAKSVNHLADIYSIGVILYRLLAGRLPFVGDLHYVLVQQMSSEPPLLRELRPDVPPDLEAVIMRCLAKDPASRWPQCRDLLTALRQSLQQNHCIDASISLFGKPPPTSQHSVPVHTLPQSFMGMPFPQERHLLHISDASPTLPTGQLLSEPFSSRPILGSSPHKPNIAHEPTQLTTASANSLKRVFIILCGLLILTGSLAFSAWWLVIGRSAPPNPHLSQAPKPSLKPTASSAASSAASSDTSSDTGSASSDTGSAASSGTSSDAGISGSQAAASLQRPGQEQQREGQGRALANLGAQSGKDRNKKVPRSVGLSGKVKSKASVAAVGSHRHKQRDGDLRSLTSPGSVRSTVRKAEILLQTNPPGAQIWIVGKRVGITPYRVQARQGEKLRIRLEKDGYMPLSFEQSMDSPRRNIIVNMKAKRLDTPPTQLPDPFAE
jgi:serine/threonine protein kinase